MFNNHVDENSFFYHIPVPIIVLDRNGEVININTEAIDMYKNALFMEDEDIYIYVKEWFKDEVNIFVESSEEKCFSFQKTLKIRKDTLYFQIKFKKVFDNNYQIQKIIVVLNDITNHKLTEIELKKSQEHFRSILQNMPIMMDAIDEKDNIIVWNKECERVTGYSQSEIISNAQIWNSLYPNEEYREKILTQIREMECNFRDLEYDIVCKDGSKKTISWFNISKEFPILGWYSWAFGIDVTHRKNTEKKLRKKTKELEKIFEALPDLYFRIDCDGNILDCKKGIYSDFSIIPNECIGQVLENVVSQEITLFLNKAIRQAFKTSSLVEKEFFVKYDKEMKYFESRVVPLTTNEMMIIIRDITNRKLTQEAKRKAEENMILLNKVVEYEKLRTEFFANISHEFRTPINVILGAIQLMDIYLNNISDTNEYGKLINLKNSMKQNCYRLIRLVNNLIDITKIDSGFLELNLENCDIVKIVKDIALSVSDFAKLKNLTLKFDSDIPKKIIACDPDKVERVLLNLLSNAIKFTKSKGEIFVSVRNRKDLVIISVKDSGIGIKKEDLKIMFQRFRQVNKSLTRENEGSGIGLSLVKQLVELHDGNIDIESEYGKGSEFIIELPVKLVEESNKISLKHIGTDKVEKISIEFSDIYF